jgi:excisionase family DNA binding protein
MKRTSSIDENVRSWYTTGQLAALLGVTDRTVVNWANAGVLAHHTTPGGHRRFARAVVERFFAEMAGTPRGRSENPPQRRQPVN